MKLRLLALGAAALSLAGCVSPAVKQYCSTADWDQVGFQDGLNGKLLKTLTVRQEYCAKTDFTVNGDAYQIGWERGVRAYCTPEGGFRSGAEDSEYNGVCADFGEAEFLAQRERGAEMHPYLLSVYAARSDLRDAFINLRTIQTGGGSTGDTGNVWANLLVGAVQGFTKQTRINKAQDLITQRGRALRDQEVRLQTYLNQLDAQGADYYLPRLFELERELTAQGVGYGLISAARFEEFVPPAGQQSPAPSDEIAAQLNAEHAKWRAKLAEARAKS